MPAVAAAVERTPAPPSTPPPPAPSRIPCTSVVCPTGRRAAAVLGGQHHRAVAWHGLRQPLHPPTQLRQVRWRQCCPPLAAQLAPAGSHTICQCHTYAMCIPSCCLLNSADQPVTCEPLCSSPCRHRSTSVTHMQQPRPAAALFWPIQSGSAGRCWRQGRAAGMAHAARSAAHSKPGQGYLRTGLLCVLSNKAAPVGCWGPALVFTALRTSPAALLARVPLACSAPRA